MPKVYKKRKTSTRRKALPRRNRFRKSSNALYVSKYSVKDSPNNVHLVMIGSDPNPAGDGSTTFALADLANFSEIQGFFDNFRILKVQYRWVLKRTQDYASTTGNRGYFPRITWVHDFNDVTYTSRLALMQRPGIKEVILSDQRPVTKWYSIRPAHLGLAFEAAGVSVNQPVWKAWLPTATAAVVPYLGIKYNYSELFAGVNIHMECKFTLQVKGMQ